MLQTISTFSLASDGATIASYVLNGGSPMTTWQKPDFTEVSMNAEIGAYQEDFGGRGNAPPRAHARTEAETQGAGKAR
jgi:hypothetical protein